MNNELLITNKHPRWVTYLFRGGIIGLVVSITVLLLSAIINGYINGMSIGSCVAYGCTLTALLSQPIGLTGLLIGAGVGCLISYVVYTIHHFEGK